MDQLDKILALNILTTIMLGKIENYLVSYQCVLEKSINPGYDDFIRYELTIKSIGEKTLSRIVYDKNYNEFSISICNGDKFDITQLMIEINPDYDVIKNDFLMFLTGILIDKLNQREHYVITGGW